MTSRITTLLAGALLTGVLALSSLIPGTVARAAQTGGILRTVTVGKAPGAIAVDERTRRAFVVNGMDGTVSVLDTLSGAVLRTVVVEQAIADKSIAGSDYKLTVDEQTGRIFVVSSRIPPARGRVIVLDARTGTVLGRTTVGVLPSAAAVSARTNRVFVTNLDSNTVSVLDGHSGQIVRTVRTGNGPSGVGVDTRTNHVFIANDDDGTLSMLDAASGALLRTIPTERTRVGYTELLAGPAGRIFVLYQNGHISLLDAATGNLVRTVVLGTEPIAFAADGRIGRIFIAHSGSSLLMQNPNDRVVSMLDARSGTLIRTVTLGLPISAIAVDARTNHVFVDRGDRVSVLDARTGMLLREIPIGGSWLMAVDTQTDHIFVTGDGGRFRSGSVSMLDAR